MEELVLPMATQIQQVIKAYGVLKFARLVKMYETQDPEIAAISVKLGSLLLPPLPPYGTSVCILHLKLNSNFKKVFPNKTYIKNITS
uniref:Protein C10 n=1 Tax=Oncorhynchus mykiss TaxID=8022 RepID=A0A8K9XHF5_ONCMY